MRLRAWNCTCAAFAFSAFPASTSGPFSPRFEDDVPGFGIGDEEASYGEEEERKWEFGGLSSDGKEGVGGAESVPCCKHLLACLLVERWRGVLGGYVKVREVGREEMAGLGVEG